MSCSAEQVCNIPQNFTRPTHAGSLEPYAEFVFTTRVTDPAGEFGGKQDPATEYRVTPGYVTKGQPPGEVDVRWAGSTACRVDGDDGQITPGNHRFYVGPPDTQSGVRHLLGLVGLD